MLGALLLRGPQTPGELKQRTQRMHAFAGLDAVHDTLERLIARELVRRMDRRPGQKEERYGHLLGEDGVEEPALTEIPVATGEVNDLEERVARLERAVAELRASVQP